MSRKKPDRWERMVDKEFGIVLNPSLVHADVANALYREAAVRLLRKEHRAVVEMVGNEPELPGEMPDEMWLAMKDCRAAATEAMRIAVRETKRNILDQLKKMAT